MSGGGGGGGKGGYGSGVGVSKGVGKTGIKEARTPTTGGGLGGRSPANGESRIAEANRVEPPRATKPQSQGPSGVDTGGAGTDDILQLVRDNGSAARSRRMRLARGGGLSNVLQGGATLG